MVRRLIIVAAVSTAFAAMAQPPGIYSKPQQAQRAREDSMRHRVPVAWGGGFGWWGPMWSSSFDYSPLTPPDKPKEMPVVVVNRDYQPERLNPVVREFGDGALAQPKRQSPPAGSRRAQCDVVYRSGVNERATDCELIDDTLRYVNASGRRITVSLDLAEPR
jgi:hypothetical protein